MLNMSNVLKFLLTVNTQNSFSNLSKMYEIYIAISNFSIFIYCVAGFKDLKIQKHA